MLTTIFIILVLVTAIFLASSVRLRFRFDDEGRYMAAGLLFAGVFYDISKRQLSFKLAGLPIKGSGLSKTVGYTARKSGFVRPKFKWDYAKWLLQLVRRIKIQYLEFDITGGFEDPYYTGQMTAIYWSAKGIAPRIMSHVTFAPDFGANRLAFKGKGLITLRMCYIIILIIRLLADSIKTKIRNLSIMRTKGVSYG